MPALIVIYRKIFQGIWRSGGSLLGETQTSPELPLRTVFDFSVEQVGNSRLFTHQPPMPWKQKESGIHFLEELGVAESCPKAGMCREREKQGGVCREREIARFLITPLQKKVVNTKILQCVRIMCITSIKHLLKKEFLLYKLCESRSLRSQLCALNLKMLSLPPCGRRKLLHIDLRNTDSPQTSCCCC